MNLLMKMFKKKTRFNSSFISKEADSYLEWKKVSMKTSDGDKFFSIQPNISSFEIEKIIEDFGHFMEEYSSEIGDTSSGGMTAIKMIYGILYAFVVRHKSDILSDKEETIIEDISGEEMMTFSINFMKLNMFNKIMESFGEDSLNILFDRFNKVLETATELNKTTDLIKKLKEAREKDKK